MKYGLPEDIIKKIKAVFASFEEVEQVIIYGSRAKGNYKPASDIDLTLKGSGLTTAILNKISWELDDLLLPYTFDLSIYHSITQADLLDHIQRTGEEFYTRQQIPP